MNEAGRRYAFGLPILGRLSTRRQQFHGQFFGPWTFESLHVGRANRHAGCAGSRLIEPPVTPHSESLR